MAWTKKLGELKETLANIASHSSQTRTTSLALLSGEKVNVKKIVAKFNIKAIV